jgi:HK97 family phage portal protein
MLIRTADGGQAELRSFAGFAGSDTIPLPSSLGGNWTVAGRRVTPRSAYGLPPVLRGIRILSETVGSLPLILYRGDPSNPATKTIVSNAPQYDLFSQKPNGLQTPYAFKAYIVASIEGFGNAYLLKAKSRGAVQELWPIDPQRVMPEPEGTTIKYKVRVGEHGQWVDMTRADLIHIPGVLTEDPFVGVSPIMLAANAMGSALAAEEYAGRFYDNDATPSGVLEGAPNSTKQQIVELKEL